MDPLPPFAVPVAVAKVVAAVVAEKQEQQKSLAEETEEHNEIMRLENERRVQEARKLFLAELEERVTRLHREELQRAKAECRPFKCFVLLFGDLCDKFKVLNVEKVVDIFATCKAAKGFDIITSMAISEKGAGFGDRSATFEWKGRNWNQRVRYYRENKEHWLSHM